MLTLVLVVILVALTFEYINGFHDTANSIATVVATKVLSPISGRIGRSAVSEGALVTNGQPNAMATVQQLDPIYVDMTQSAVEMMGLRKAMEAGRILRNEEGGARVKLRLEDGSLYESSLVSAAETCDVVIAVGWQFYDALDSGLAIDFPEVQFIFIDNELSDRGDNLMSIIYAQNEGSFLVGYIAGKLTKTNKIGVVGGQDAPTINDFIVGYEAGAKYVNPDIVVERKYAETYEDPSKGLELANALYGSGCDIVFAVAGKTGEGVFESAAATGNYAIGVDSDQKYINPNVIICSMVKDVGKSLYNTIANMDENFKGGQIWCADMATGYIGVAYGTEDMPQQVSDELKAEVEVLAQKIVSGEIVVPSTLQ